MSDDIRTAETRQPRMPWSKGKLTGPKPPLKVREIWAIRIRLQLVNKPRDLALFATGGGAGSACAVAGGALVASRRRAESGRRPLEQGDPMSRRRVAAIVSTLSDPAGHPSQDRGVPPRPG